MLLRIARKEFLDLARDGRLRWAGVTIGGLLLVSLAAGVTASRAATAERDAAQSQMAAWWYKQPPKNAHSAAHYGLWAFKPMPVLSYVDRGVDPYTGTATWLEAHRQNDFRFRPAMDMAALQRFGDWTAASVLQALIPLLVIVLAFSAFAGEREAGTLRQLASLGVPARVLVAGKALGVVGALAVVLVPAALLGSAALLAGAGARDVARFVALSGLYLGWFALVLAVTLAVSLTAGSARRALLLLLGLWAFNSMVAPRIATSVGAMIHPTPSRVNFTASVDRALAQGLDGHDPAGERAQRLEAELFAKYNVRDRTALPVNFDAVAMQASEEHADEVFDHHFGRLHEQYRDQNRVQQVAAIAAPLLSVRFLSSVIAGTDLESHRAFAVASEAYRRLIQVRMNGWLARNTKIGDTFRVRSDSTLWAEVPPFEYTAPVLTTSLGWYRVSIAVLAAWLALAIGYLASRRRLPVL
ncbi:MAG TPA: DUF3526 domain-containing protein [Gemmatimonas sp.]|nr:DUF3526 domain-containing protein [Gemmatimonas sp.]